MSNATEDDAVGACPPIPEDDAWRRLMHRWFVQYNPLYLASATLVLGGIWLLSREAAGEAATFGHLSIAALAEVYACCLIGGAALLWRLELKRPAVMLGLLAALYQADLTLHVETSAYLGGVGYVSSIAWVALFMLKLRALAWALGLRLSRSAFCLPSAGAMTLALLPQLFRELGPDSRTVLLGLFVFGLGAAASWTSRRVESESGFDVRGLRALHGTWILWAVVGLAHVCYWSSEHELELAVLLPVAALLGARHLERERHVWALGVFVIFATAVLLPVALSSVALMTATVLVLRARRAVVQHEAPQPELVSPYRERAPELVVRPMITHFEPASLEAQRRLLLGAAVSLYVGLWTLGWSGGPWPQHMLILDATLVLGLTLAFYRSHRLVRLAPVVATLAHLSIQRGWVSAPEGAHQWGLASVGLGFAFLLGSLAVSYRLRRHVSTAAP